ncbi:MAG: class I SAM-dependent methyltransferase [Deltaproteobacteria bacterium]|nr:class I SAM-dependent methyltransferase [Deltaproteobacteria bacterium]
MRRRFLRSTVLGVVLVITVFVYFVIGAGGEQTRQMEDVHHGFSDIGQWSQILEGPERDKWQKPDEVVKNLNLKPGDVIADIGAGTGYFTRRFAVAVGPEGKALGLEIEPSMVAHMKEDAQKLKLPNYEPRLVRPDDPELGSRSVDVIFLCDAYHHIGNRVAYLKRLTKSLKPNGRVVIVDFHDRPSPVGPVPKLSEQIVIKEFQQAGYYLIRSLDFLPYQYFLEFGS